MRTVGWEWGFGTVTHFFRWRLGTSPGHSTKRGFLSVTHEDFVVAFNPIRE